MNIARKRIGIAAVIVVSLALLVLIVIFMNKRPAGVDSTVTQAGDWQFENVMYEYDRQIKTILFIGVGDSKTAGPNRSVKYLTLLAYNELEGTYSLLNIDPDTAVNVKIVNAQGSADGETYYGRIGDAQQYGDGHMISCRNTVMAVKELLDYKIEPARVVCIRVGSQTPTFTYDPLRQLEELIGEDETDEVGEYVSSIVFSDIAGKNRLSEYWNALKLCTKGQQYTIEGREEEGLFVPDDRSLKLLIRDLYYKKVS